VTDTESWRKTTQRLAPAKHTASSPGNYDLYPSFPLESGKIALGFEALVDLIANSNCVVLDGYGGVFWEDFRSRLENVFSARNIRTAWVNIESALRPSIEIEALVEPFLGGDDPIFGRRFTGTLEDFFDANKLEKLCPNSHAQINLIYGCGASLAGWNGLLIFLDVPKNEIQFRARAGKVSNLGTSVLTDAKTMYKRFYFVDWIVLNQHKARLLERIDVILDHQRPDKPSFMLGNDFRQTLEVMTHNFFRARPWFEPGPWGGQWIKKYLPELPQDAPNYAWSFELITPENGLMLQSDGLLLEVSFDVVMFYDHRAVLGDAAERFGFEFPIRFDWLDTVGGGKLSLQVHPSPEYAATHFGETFTQDETYYILECDDSAEVYLGFQESVNPLEFRSALEHSHEHGTPLEVDQFVQRHPAKKHDLFLIPHGTIHCSGAGSLVLEISATPYIFTFKMYDWLRLDLDGKPRPLNIARAFENLDFSRCGERVQELFSKPVLVSSGDGWSVFKLPTHPDHFYDIQRLEFQNDFEARTENTCHVLCLVEGSSIMLETAGGLSQRFNYAETFVIPAAAGSYRLRNENAEMAKVVRAFVRPQPKASA
jgi:mannose-6-phosphate isomerase class I